MVTKHRDVMACAGAMFLALFLFAAVPAFAEDTDGDGIEDTLDNCRLVANPNQSDADEDGFGDICDGDLNNDGATTAQDTTILRSHLGTSNPVADLTGDGFVNAKDTTMLRGLVGSPPGPGALPASDITYPLRVEPGKRYLVDASGKPFFMNGDTAWDLIVGPDLAGARLYLDDRSARGINTVLVELVEHAFAGPATASGLLPFSPLSDFGAPNEAYFNYARQVVEEAAQRGMLVLLTPAYLGYNAGNEGWLVKMRASGATKLRAYGVYVGQKFAGLDNILWVHGGDHDPSASDMLLADAVAEGIISTDPQRRWLHTFHAQRGTSAMRSRAGSRAWLDVNNIYTSSTDVVTLAHADYALSAKPLFFLEGRYETNGGSGLFIRQQAYQALLSGSHTGHLMGNDPIWYFGSGWQSYLGSAGARSMPHIDSLWHSLPWERLVPDTAGTFLTGGTGSSEGRSAAALAADGSFGLVYHPDNTRSFTVNMGRFTAATVRARWFDPSSGTYSTVAGSPFAASGSRTFRPTGLNASGARDWVLVLD